VVAAPPLIPLRQRLLTLLADGGLHSGAKLAAELGVTRAAIWKSIAELRARGIAVLSLDRRGYRLPAPVELLDARQLCEMARAVGCEPDARFELQFELGSTSDLLYAATAPPPGAPRVLFAELQSAGRGRRGRTWHAPFASGLTFSIGWSFAETPPDIAALSLAMGVQAAQALHDIGATGVRLKWPNDLLLGHRKLGGLLAQLRSETGGPGYVVIGLGLNLDIHPAGRAAIIAAVDTSPGDVREALGGAVPQRNRTAAIVSSAMLQGLAVFERQGFAPFAQRWAELDALRDAPVRLLQGTDVLEGIARGVDRDGALLVEREGRMQRFVSGDVTLRSASAGSAG
jgi:BirA family biotin operon repressor/biotin-[acetyl-CoA-carboxylase] ligase